MTWGYYTGVFALLLTGTCIAVDFNEDFINFFYTRIPQLAGQRSSGGRQFAALILLTQADINNIGNFQFEPHTANNQPVVDRTQSSSPPNPVNYVVARPDRNTDMHAEEILLSRLQEVYNAFRNTIGAPPAMILLFSRLFPCSADTPGETHDCSTQIIQIFGEAPYNTLERGIIYDDAREAIQPTQTTLMNFGMNMGAFPIGLDFQNCFGPRFKRAGETCQVPSLQGFQGCVLDCLKEEFLSCVQDSDTDKQKAYFVNVLVDTCLLSDNLESCFHTQVSQLLGGACKGLNKERVANDMRRCAAVCKNTKTVAMSIPRNVASDYKKGKPLIILNGPSTRHHFISPTSSCKDQRRSGLLCSEYNQNYLTAGNSLCREDHACGNHGYPYRWCYTDYSNNWDYCCADACEYKDGYDYLWCNAGGGEWQYCGKAGTKTVNNVRCLADMPCGLHREISKVKYFWCYKDINKNWNYCCSPEPEYNKCNYYGSSYKWCKTGIWKTWYKDYWQKCK